MLQLRVYRLSVAELLSRHYQVVLMERRDYGISGTGARPATFARQAEDIAAVLGALDGPSYVFGHSCGGLATLHAATIAAARMRAMAPYEPPIALAGGAVGTLGDNCRALVRAGRGSGMHHRDAGRPEWLAGRHHTGPPAHR
jgi:pimeloyl-ACP methyl ester carboxylesterase